jgi:hypothetical protein
MQQLRHSQEAHVADNPPKFHEVVFSHSKSISATAFLELY